MAATKETSKPLSDLMFDWITVLHNKAEGVAAYDKYLQDAKNENATECVAMLEQLREQDVRTLEEVKQHVFDMIANCNDQK